MSRAGPHKPGMDRVGACLYGICPAWLGCQCTLQQAGSLLGLVMLLQQVELRQAKQGKR